MKLQEIDLEYLFLWAEETGFSTSKTITSLIGFSAERISKILKSTYVNPYKTIEAISEYTGKPLWDRLPSDEQKFRKLCKQFKTDTLLELFFELGKLQGMREAWYAIENDEGGESYVLEEETQNANASDSE